MSDQPDDLADALRPAFAPPDHHRREAVLRQTLGLLRRRVLLRRAAAAVGAVGLFLIGGVAGWVVKPTPAPAVVRQEAPHPPPQVDPSSPRESEPLSAAELELKAELADDPADAARLFRQAGDRFLADRDYDNAARCYRRHLNAADDEARRASADDSWLLLSLKSPLR